MQRHFDEELNQLKERLLRMSSLAEKAISSTIKALIDRDAELALSVADSDDPINMLEIEIEEFCLKLLALHQPQAGDLRFIIAAMKINNDLERVGDLAVNIAKVTKYLIKIPVVKSLNEISDMAKAAQKMLKDSLDAFVNKDAQLAKNVCKRDDEVDNMNKKIFMNFLSSAKDPKAVEYAVDLILIAKNFERIADHSTNICEDVVYLVEGKTVKHHIEERQIILAQKKQEKPAKNSNPSK